MKKFYMAFGVSMAIFLSACKDQVVQLKTVSKPVEKTSAIATMSGAPTISHDEMRTLNKSEPATKAEAEGLKKIKELNDKQRLEIAKLEVQRLAEEVRQKMLKAEIEKLSASIFYLKDKFGLCYAVLPNSITLSREQSVVSFASVPCEKVGLLEKKQ